MSFVLAPEVREMLRAVRADGQLSQADLGKRCGVSQQTIHGIEQGRHGLSAALAIKLATELAIPVGDLMAVAEAPLRLPRAIASREAAER